MIIFSNLLSCTYNSIYYIHTMRKSLPTVLTIVYLLLLCLPSTATKILQITQKNLPNVLKFQSDILILYHHPDCEYSINYKIKFTNYFQNTDLTQNGNGNVGIVDCLQEAQFCGAGNVSRFPYLSRVYSNDTVQYIQPHLYIATLQQQYQSTDQYLAAQIANKLKEHPNFVIVLFEQEGLPVSENSKIKNHEYSDHIFYLSEGRVARTLSGFVKNKMGCWILALKSQQSGQLFRNSCGDTYQSPTELTQILQSQLNSTQNKGSQADLIDKSNHQNEVILGYKQLVYSLKHYDLHLEISTHSKISICSFIYLWGDRCQHCNYDEDLRVVNRTIEGLYERQRRTMETDVVMKSKVYTYDITTNKIVFKSEDFAKIAGLNSTQVNHLEQHQLLIVPNLYSVCLGSYDNRHIPESVNMYVNRMDKIICAQNINEFVKSSIKQQYSHISRISKQSNKQQNSQL